MSTMTVEKTPRAEPYATDPLDRYLKQIGRIPLLTAEQEVELGKRIEAGLYARHLLDADPEPPQARKAELEAVARDGSDARDDMIRANLRLVVSVAKRYVHQGLPLLDVIQEGNIGLIRAVDKFDYTRGCKFSTCAMWWIRQAIQRGLAEKSRMIRLPTRVVDDIARLARIERELAAELGHDPNIEELAAEAGQPVEKVAAVKRLPPEPVSLDALVGEEEQTRLGELVVDEESSVEEVVERRELADGMRSLLDDTLAPRQALLMRLRYGMQDGIAHTPRQIAERLGLTGTWVRLLERESLARLRDTGQARALAAPGGGRTAVPQR
ncbi:sigma-70 family RNA polymerase sigma factor [Planobispora longispora]|uniref:RNA polymerase principal sigma factor HrdC n=1 Tax=Planobispora longispora TaxID=28887 RepID=A0A8J3RM82_9ACTN|nr:sigma-70 family RNA polymerase sigma factor [Planobispora longispora]BFE79414.1 sigma-70 family RNA polymerase sigma factor [Planobispora longispora]GIH78247.1 RNA polymerase principal sigma factor HrdC [Planobispora longispora]